jgi:DnaJ-domain-containing protein 1
MGFYKGMSAAQIEGELRRDSGWQRPTWPLGRLGGGAAWSEEQLHDPLGILERRRRAPEPPRVSPPFEIRQPLDTLGLPWPVSLEQVKARYKALAKEHHPDRNGGDKAAEERLKDINLAYAAVRTHLGQDMGRMAATG